MSQKDNTAESRAFLEYTHDNFLAHVIEDPIKGDALLNLMLTEKLKLINWLADINLEG